MNSLWFMDVGCGFLRRILKNDAYVTAVTIRRSISVFPLISLVLAVVLKMVLAAYPLFVVMLFQVLHITLSWKAKRLMIPRRNTSTQPSFSQTASSTLLSTPSFAIGQGTRQPSVRHWTCPGFQPLVEFFCRRKLKGVRRCLKRIHWNVAAELVTNRLNWKCPVQITRT